MTTLAEQVDEEQAEHEANEDDEPSLPEPEDESDLGGEG